MTVKETCVYCSDKNDESRIVCEKTVVVTSELFGFKTTLETFAVQRYTKNQELASLGLEFHKLFLPQLSLSPIIGITISDTRNLSSKLSDTTKKVLQAT